MSDSPADSLVHVVESVTVEIDAPAAYVWEVLVDYPRYPEWNPFTVRVETTLVIGDPIDLYLPQPNDRSDGSDGTFLNREFIRVVDAPYHLRYDTAEEMPGLFASRDQWLDPLGPDRCAYRTTDAMSGELAAWVVETNGAWVKAGFDEMAAALKDRAETLYAAER
jgi:hypothetical protein